MVKPSPKGGFKTVKWFTRYWERNNAKDWIQRFYTSATPGAKKELLRRIHTRLTTLQGR